MRTVLLLLALVSCLLGSSHGDENSCVGRCGDSLDTSFPCQCNTFCTSHSDCCSDYGSVCQGSCEGKCGNHFDPALTCQCNTSCEVNSDCCPDYSDTCGGSSGGVTEEELQELSEMLLLLDTDNVGSMISLDLGGTTSTGQTQDVSPNPLFASVGASVPDMEIYRRLAALYDNYDARQTIVEDHTEQEQQEERDFLQLVLESDIMQETYAFLAGKGVFSGTYEEWGNKLYTLWFGQYVRKGALSTSGFEHVFIGEIDGSKVSGFHNWFHWYLQEQSGNINYLGYWRGGEFGESAQFGRGLEFTYTWDGNAKPYGSMFIGTSPQLELALYSTCLLTMPDKICHVTLAGTDVYIQTWSQYYNGELHVGSSYPDFGQN